MSKFLTRRGGAAQADLGSDELVQATASDAAQGKLAAATLGYFKDPYIGLLAGGGGEPARRLPPVINRGREDYVGRYLPCVGGILQDFELEGASRQSTKLWCCRCGEICNVSSFYFICTRDQPPLIGYN